ncbi:putative tricarboxylic transport membrane protein [Monaibacterium marinum]|uniref:Putative tricarboxylic transport membrane protein n=1 Tax=Pontivivens marinum TaxID=1690039 RepID=A0A2C9CUK6_9RHOB|nr:tripartite tricarboxylate transporter TctB family protein [Monaibacterium marinum]SOH94918.1 putative tricarboxylic transport membrane protein [Monaibacterium marinum]
MNSTRFSFTAETYSLIVILVAAVLSLIFLGSLVATPRALFGQSLSAIAPSLFPGIVLTILSALCIATLILFKADPTEQVEERLTGQQWQRAFVFFGIMILYGLTMVPLGFLISTAIATTLISLQMGSRSVLQIGGISLVGPVLLYLAATRLLAVSLPELNAIEVAYSSLLNL